MEGTASWDYTYFAVLSAVCFIASMYFLGQFLAALDERERTPKKRPPSGGTRL